jgi:hypothetical protein
MRKVIAVLLSVCLISACERTRQPDTTPTPVKHETVISTPNLTVSSSNTLAVPQGLTDSLQSLVTPLKLVLYLTASFIFIKAFKKWLPLGVWVVGGALTLGSYLPLVGETLGAWKEKVVA